MVLLLQLEEEPTCLKAAWDLMEIFYVDKQSRAWLPERLVDWLAVMIFPLLLLLFSSAFRKHVSSLCVCCYRLKNKRKRGLVYILIKLIITSCYRIMMVFFPGQIQQFIQSFWVCRRNLSICRFGFFKFVIQKLCCHPACFMHISITAFIFCFLFFSLW